MQTLATRGTWTDWLRRPFVIALLYLVFGWIWIGTSDWLAYRFMPNEATLTRFQSMKGMLFIAATGAFLFALLVWRKRSQQEAETELQLVVNQLPGFLWTTDEELRLRTVTGQDWAGFAVQPDRLTGRKVTDLVDGAERRAVIETAHRRALAGESADFAVDIMEHDFVVRIEPLRAPSDRIVGCVAFALDVSGLRLADSPRGVRDALRHSHVMATVGTLVLEVAHKLKNPLFAMTAALDGFEARVGDQPETAPHREILRQQVDRVQALVEGLQVYGRVGEMDLQPCEVSGIVRNVTLELANLGREANVDVIAEVSTNGGLQAALDREALAEALRRVGVNALQYSAPGQVVAISLLQATDKPDHLEITVDDAGPGFHPDDHERAFEPLFSRGTDGAGLGLSIAERIVHLHGGSIDLGESPQGGARVRITLGLS